jgi:4-carboxymuconolactone decarboxylase
LDVPHTLAGQNQEENGLGRLSAVFRDALPENERRFYDAVLAIRRRPVSGPFIVTMNSSPDLAARIAHLGHYFHARGQTDESIVSLRVRAFIALIGSRALDAPYEWSAWVNWALEAGVPQDTVDAIREGTPPSNLTDEETLVADLCRQLLSGNHRVSKATYRAALERYGVQGLVELVATLGYFALIALPLNAFEIEMSSEQKGLRKPFAPLVVRGKPGVDQDGERADLPPMYDTATLRTLSAPRVPLLSIHDDVAREHQHFLDRIVRTRGWIAPAFQVLLHSPDAAERMANVGAFLLYDGAVPPAVRALVGLIAARELDSDYVWTACMRSARAANLDGGLIEALDRGKPLGNVRAEQQALIDFCYQLLRGNHHVGETTYQSTIARFGIPMTVQITVTLGYFVMMGLVVNAFEVPANDDSRPAL